jgi:hypothetical protein
LDTYGVELPFQKVEPMNLKHQLKTYMDYRNINAATLAKKSKVPKQNISLWLAGTEPKKITQVRSVAGVLGTTVDHLCFGSGIEELKEQQTVELHEILGDKWITGCLEFKIKLKK